MNDEFEIYLVSNGSMNLFPDNKLSSFKNHLVEPLQLDSAWRVALSAVSTPAVVFNVTEKNFTSMKKVYTEEELEYMEIDDDPTSGGRTELQTCDLQPGIYSTVEKLLDYLNESAGLETEKSQIYLGSKELSIQQQCFPTILYTLDIY